jgi:hypothetical protein
LFQFEEMSWLPLFIEVSLWFDDGNQDLLYDESVEKSLRRSSGVDFQSAIIPAMVDNSNGGLTAQACPLRLKTRPT